MSFDTFTLATHAAATPAGFDVRLDPDTDLSSGIDREWCLFTPGPNGMKLFKDPNEWLASLRPAGFESAFYGVEEGLPRRTWGLLMDRPGERYYWDLKISTVSEENRSWQRGWFMAEKTPDVTPPPEFDLRTLAEELDARIVAMLEFAREYRQDDWHLIERLESAQAFSDAFLTGDESVTIPARLRSSFPSAGYSREKLLLGAATFESSLFGGRGPWDDWASQDVEIADRFRRITKANGTLWSRCITAVSMADSP